MEFYMENRENGRMILDSVQNGLPFWPTIIEDDGLPPDVYAIVNHHKVAKEIWDRVKLLVQGMKFSLQEKEYSGLAILVLNQGDDLISRLNKAMAFLTTVACSRGNNARGQARVVKCYNCQGEDTNAFQTEDLDAYDSGCDDVSNDKAVLMANLSNYGSDVISEIKPTLYDGSVISKQHVASPMFEDDETLILEEVSRSKMLAKQNDPISKEKKVNTTPINYAELNGLSKYFGKRFVPQQELSDEQAFWLQTSHPNTDQSASSPIKIEVPRELLRITPKKIVHLKETTSISVETSKPEIKVYSRRPKQVKSVGSSKKDKIVQSKIANNTEPTHLWGSNTADIPSSSSLVNDRLSILFSGIWTPDAQNNGQGIALSS
nr:hypothetical protein [Tanacetum cinerariifolium]